MSGLYVSGLSSGLVTGGSGGGGSGAIDPKVVEVTFASLEAKEIIIGEKSASKIKTFEIFGNVYNQSNELKNLLHLKALKEPSKEEGQVYTESYKIVDELLIKNQNYVFNSNNNIILVFYNNTTNQIKLQLTIY